MTLRSMGNGMEEKITTRVKKGFAVGEPVNKIFIKFIKYLDLALLLGLNKKGDLLVRTIGHLKLRLTVGFRSYSPVQITSLH